MPTDLTEEDEFTTPITVPLGADSRADAADVVAAIAQRLANRTNNLNLHGAKKDAANTFSQPQQIDANLTVNGTTDTDDLSVSGTAAVQTLTVNDDAHVLDDVTIDGSLDVGFDIFAGDDVIAGDEFQYSPQKTRVVLMDLFNSFGEGVLSLAGGTFHVQLTTAGNTHSWPIKLPEGATLTKIEALLSKAGTGGTNVTVWKKDTYDWTNPVSAVPVETNVGSVISFVAGNVVVSPAPGGLNETFNNDQKQYFVTITAGDNLDEVYGLRVTYQDPGPRNH